MTDSATFGVYSEVGKLRKVIVHRPDLSLRRLTPSNHDDLLFDDVLWVERAQKEHDAFVQTLRSRGAEVFYVHELLAEALAASDEARVQVIEAVANESTVGWSIVDEIRAMLEKLSPAVLAKHLIGGLTVSELDPDWERLKASSLLAAANEDPDLFVLPPLPNTLFTRDSSAWIFNGVTVNPMFWPARRRESLNLLTIYRYHPMFKQAQWQEWYPGRAENGDDTLRLDLFGAASMEGGDIQPIGNKTVLIGFSERTTGRMIEHIAAQLFEAGAAERVIAAIMTKDRAHMHLDTVFTMLDREVVTAFPGVVTSLPAMSLRPSDRPGDFDVTIEKDFLSAVSDALGVRQLRVIETGGDSYQAAREQWDDANNTVALEPGVVVSYERNTFTIAKMREAGIEVVEIAGFELGKGRGGGHCMTCPILPRPGLGNLSGGFEHVSRSCSGRGQTPGFSARIKDGTTTARHPLWAHPGHRADHGEHNRRWDFQPPELAGLLWPDHPRLDGAYDGRGVGVRGCSSPRCRGDCRRTAAPMPMAGWRSETGSGS